MDNSIHDNQLHTLWTPTCTQPRCVRCPTSACIGAARLGTERGDTKTLPGRLQLHGLDRAGPDVEPDDRQLRKRPAVRSTGQGHPKIVSKPLRRNDLQDPPLSTGDLSAQPSGPDGEGQAEGQALDARGET